MQQPSTQARKAASYGITVDKSSLEGHAIDAGVTNYTVVLSGQIDERWTRAFQIVQMDSTGMCRYRLDSSPPRVTFQIRTTAGASRVILLLERLDRLVEDVNLSASYWGHEPG